jgi:hypothetical protein
MEEAIEAAFECVFAVVSAGAEVCASLVDLAGSAMVEVLSSAVGSPEQSAPPRKDVCPGEPAGLESLPRFPG